MTPAESARANAISMEVKKDGLQQRQNGDWVVRLTVAGIDMHERIMKAPMGTRFVCVLVEVDDNEEPKEAPAQETTKLPSCDEVPFGKVEKLPAAPVDKEPRERPEPKHRRQWSELSPVEQAGIRCGEPTFHEFLKATRPRAWSVHASVKPADAAAIIVRAICRVDSRSELAGAKAKWHWDDLQKEFENWKLADAVVPA